MRETKDVRAAVGRIRDEYDAADGHVAPRPPASRWLVLIAMCAGYFLVLLDVTIVNVALPRVAQSLGSSVAGLQWVVDGYAVALAALMLASGTIGDLRGHKRVVLAGLAVFAAGSLGCALAPGTAVLIGARILQGVGAALLLPGTLAIITRSFPDRTEHARAIGVWAAVGSLALPAGPLLGGFLVTGLGWRWVFVVNLPIVLIAGAVALRRVPADPPQEGGSIDRVGIALGALTLTAVTLAVVRLGRSGVDGVTIASAAVAVAACVGFVATERRVTTPMLPLGLFHRPAFSAANAVAGLMNFGTLGLLFLLTLFLQTIQQRSALAAGAATLPLFLPLTIIAPVAGRAAGRYGPKAVMIAGLTVAAGGVALLATWSADSPYADLLPAMLAWGVGLALLTPAVVAAAIGSVPAARAGLASAVNNTARQAGGAVGIALYGAVAGTPKRSGGFIDGLHVTGLITASLFLVGGALTAVFIPLRPGAAAGRAKEP